jgi:uncharacterized membrane protein (DUF485 family)
MKTRSDKILHFFAAYLVFTLSFVGLLIFAVGVLQFVIWEYSQEMTLLFARLGAVCGMIVATAYCVTIRKTWAKRERANEN